MFKLKYVPVSVGLELTRECNMRCVHCGSSAGDVRSGELTTKELIDLCKKLKKLKTKLITFSGGEPLIRKDWYEIGLKVKELRMDLSIISNGYNIDERVVTKFKEINLCAVGISLDAATPEIHDSIRRIKGSFDKCLKVLKLLRENDISTTVVTTISKENIKELPKIREILLDKNIAWQIQIAIPIGRFPKELILSKEEYYSVSMFISSTLNSYSKKRMPVMGAHSIGYNSEVLRSTMLVPRWNGCQAGISALGIESNGGVKGCLSLPSNFVEDNIRNRDISDIWNDPNMFSYNRKFTKGDLKNDCRDCKYGRICKGGCLTVSTALKNEPHCNPYCQYLIEQEMVVE